MSDSYFFTAQPNQSPGVLSWDALQMRRKLALQLAARARPYPKTIGEGLTALGEGWADRQMFDRLAQEEARFEQQGSDVAAGLPPRIGTAPSGAPPAAPAPVAAPAPQIRAEAAPMQTAA